MIAAALLLALAPPAPITFESAAEVVLLDVFVTRNGQPVTGLTAEDFEISEGGARLPGGKAVELVSPEEVPLAALLVFDTSGSMAGAKLEHLQRASHAFVSGLGPRDEAALITFSQGLDLRAALTPDRDALQRGLAQVVPQGRTSVYDALFSSLMLARWLPGRPVVLVFSDGEDTSSWLGPESLLRVARESDTLVYAVGAGAQSLAELTRITGGRSLAEDSADLQSTFARVLLELRTRYLLRVVPRTSAPGWHAIRVRVKNRDLEVRARPGYWRPKPHERGRRQPPRRQGVEAEGAP